MVTSNVIWGISGSSVSSWKSFPAITQKEANMTLTWAHSDSICKNFLGHCALHKNPLMPNKGSWLPPLKVSMGSPLQAMKTNIYYLSSKLIQPSANTWTTYFLLPLFQPGRHITLQAHKCGYLLTRCQLKQTNIALLRSGPTVYISMAFLNRASNPPDPDPLPGL